MDSLITQAPENKYTVEIEISESTMERLEELAHRLGTTVEREIECMLEADTLAELEGLNL